MRSTVLSLAISMLSATAAHAVELGPVYPITSYLAGTQGFVACSRAANGDTLSVWNDYNRTRYLKRLDARGAIIGGVENVILPADTVAIAANKVGSYFVLHTKKATGSENIDLYGSVYNRNGALIAGPVRVNDSLQTGVAGKVTAASDGSFTVAWTGWSNLQPFRVYARRMSGTGTPITNEKLMASNTSYAMVTGVDTDPNGIVVVAYSARDSAGRTDTYTMRYSSPAGWFSGPTRVNTYLGPNQIGGTLSMNSLGNYVVTWSTYGQNGAGYSTHAQFFAADGSRQNGTMQISSALSANDTNPNVVLFDNNSYAVAWNENIGQANTFKLRQVGGPFSGFVGAETAVSQPLPVNNQWAMCGDTSGNISVKWHDYRATPTSHSDVYAHDYVADSVPPVTPLANNQQVTSLSDQTGGWKYYKVEVPANTTNMLITLASQTQPASGNADLYLRFGGMPSAAMWDTRTTAVGNTEGLSINTPPAGTFYIGVYGQAAYAGVTMTVSYR